MKKHISFRILVIALWSLLFIGVLQLPQLLEKESKNTLNIFTWADYFEDESILEEFEERTGIKVNLHTFTSNEEMQVKLHTGDNKYDLIVASDYAVRSLIRDEMLMPLDHQRFEHMSAIARPLLNQDYDPHNRYSLPNVWETYGLGVNKSLQTGDIPPTLDAIFDPKGYHLSMTPDPGESIVLAAHYLYGKTDRLTKEQADQVLELLKKQKNFTEAYVDYRAKYLLQTKNCPVAILRSSFVFQIMKENDFMAYIPPQDATFMDIENLVIPKTTKKVDHVYKLINFLYEPKIQAKLICAAPMYPVVSDALDYLDQVPEYFDNYHASLRRDDFVYFKRLLSEEETRNLWIDLKANK